MLDVLASFTLLPFKRPPSHSVQERTKVRMMLVYVPEKIHSCDQKQQIDLCCCQIVGFKKLSSTKTELNFFFISLRMS